MLQSERCNFICTNSGMTATADNNGRQGILSRKGEYTLFYFFGAGAVWE